MVKIVLFSFLNLNASDAFESGVCSVGLSMMIGFISHLEVM